MANDRREWIAGVAGAGLGVACMPIPSSAARPANQEPRTAMQQTRLSTITVGALGAANATTLAGAQKSAPVRVVIRNVGPITLFLSMQAQDLLGQAPSTDTFRLVPASEIVLVLAPLQNVYALGTGGGGLASVAVSEAFPVGVGGL